MCEIGIGLYDLMLQVLESNMDKPIIQSIRPQHKNFDLRNAIDVRLHISSENAK